MDLETGLADTSLRGVVFFFVIFLLLVTGGRAVRQGIENDSEKENENDFQRARDGLTSAE